MILMFLGCGNEVVGVGVYTDDYTGMAIGTMEGVPVDKIDCILQEMVHYSNKIIP